MFTFCVDQSGSNCYKQRTLRELGKARSIDAQPDDLAQSKRFIDMAREVEGYKEGFECALKKVAKEKPEKAKR